LQAMLVGLLLARLVSSHLVLHTLEQICAERIMKLAPGEGWRGAQASKVFPDKAIWKSLCSVQAVGGVFLKKEKKLDRVSRIRTKLTYDQKRETRPN
jgi:hypothetical protein